MIFVYKAKRPSPALINNADNKSINSTNSKDSGTGESTKRSEEQIYNECNYSILKTKMYKLFD